MQYVVVLTGHLVQLVVHVAADGGTILFDRGDVPYRVVGIAVGGVVAVSNGTDEMGACIGSAATCQVGISFGQQNCAGGFDDALRGESAIDILFVFPSIVCRQNELGDLAVFIVGIAVIVHGAVGVDIANAGDLAFCIENDFVDELNGFIAGFVPYRSDLIAVGIALVVFGGAVGRVYNVL